MKIKSGVKQNEGGAGWTHGGSFNGLSAGDITVPVSWKVSGVI